MKTIIATLLFLLVAAVSGAQTRLAPPIQTPSAKLGTAIQTIRLNLSSVVFSQPITIEGGPENCPRCFVGLFPSGGPTAVRLQWAYLDNTQNNSDAAIKTRKLTGGIVTFNGILISPALSYEARFLQWKPDLNHVVLLTIPIMQPIPKVERRTYVAEGAKATREPVGNRDEVTVTRTDGGTSEVVTMDRGVLFEMTPVATTTEPHIKVISEP